MSTVLTPSITNLISIARKIKPAKIGYDQARRWTWLDKKNRKILDNKSADCSSLCAGLAYLAGWNVNINGTCFTGNLDVLMKAAGWKVYKFTKLSDVKPGDMVLKKGKHVVLVLSKSEWLSAQSDERGKASGGKLGDQTGNEIVIRQPYTISGGWEYILRPPADVTPVEPTPPTNTVTITESQLAGALKGAGSSTTRSKVRTRKDGTTVDTSLSQLASMASEAFAGRSYNAHAISVWVATMLQESAWLATTVEYGTDTKKYDPYRGRTFEQVTWKDNYAEFGKWAKDKGYILDANYFVNNPELLGDLRWAWLGGIWYFDNRKLWDWASKGDFQRVQTAVNMGTASTTKVPSGWFPRLRAYRAFLSEYAKPKAISVSGIFDKSTKERLQEFIGAAIDGDIGAQSYFLMGQWLELGATFNINNKTHVKTLQKKIGLTGSNVDGVWFQPKSKVYGPVTTKALQTYLNTYR